MSQNGQYVGLNVSPETTENLNKWIVENQIPNPLNKFHITLIGDKYKKFPWVAKEFQPNIIIDPETFSFGHFGVEEEILVLKFDSDLLVDKHYQARLKHNIPWDFPNFQPHLSISYNSPNTSIRSIPDFPIIITGEYVVPWS